MDLKQSYASLTFDLESQELSSGGKCSDRVYAQLLAIYLLSNDLQNAKFLWKRIPVQTKNGSQDLKEVWQIGKLLLQRKSSLVYPLIDAYQWPPFLANIMNELKEEIKAQQFSLIQKSYSYITLANFKKMLYLKSNEELVAMVNMMGWQMDEEGVLVTKAPPVFESLSSNQEHLQKLVEHVTFLEF